MGVLSCSRRNCENIMCDRYSSLYGYICNECFNELVSRGVSVSVGEFMDTPKREQNEDAVRAYYENIFIHKDEL